MNKHNILKNTFYAFLLQFTNLLFPLVTAPYISRVIGSEGLGKVNFSFSVVGWFALISVFGTATYGAKEIAKNREDEYKLSSCFSELFFIKIIATVFSLALYLPSVFFVERFRCETLLFLIQGIALLLNIFSLDWFFQGLEDYKNITLRSILFKVMSILALFVLVNEKQDYIIYSGIYIFALSASNIISYIYARKYLVFAWNLVSLKRHIRPLAVFFLSSVIISVYATLDQVLLGFLKSEKDVAWLVRAKMMLGCSMIVSLTISNIIMPRLNNYFVNSKQRYVELLKYSINIILMLSTPIMAGTVVLAKHIMFLLGGYEFMPSSIALIIISPLTVIVPVGTWCYQQRILPLGIEKIGLYIQISSALISVALNIILIPILGFIGAAISYLITETSATIIGLNYIHNWDGFRTFSYRQLKYVIASGVMVAYLIFIQMKFEYTWTALFINVTSGAMLYFIMLLLMREELLCMTLKLLMGKIIKA